ncbi:hypothetical protein [Bosea sp. (in: a-proteobacteria)]|uniref:hypothetical protein n=1 Tax=Bosea sp. (in: a-proteobacteria) TaxID=1871050 RepID=UPI00403331D2
MGDSKFLQGNAGTPQRPVAASASPPKPQELLTRKDSQELMLVRVVMAIGKNTNKNFGSNWDSISTRVVAELRAQQLFDENRNFNAEQCRTLYKKLQDSWKLFNNAMGPNRTGFNNACLLCLLACSLPPLSQL